ncbi:ABC transporter permease subunit [Actinopolymorpha alba]|uniref:ABC transporter permease n=1 Tax=Actinopolymorpha alba TaxID=533267 RepID=UPI00037DC701|nr:ABC transporter permease subunit [Actinopolymorpha alba]
MNTLPETPARTGWLPRGSLLLTRRALGPDWRAGFLFVAPMVLLIGGLIAIPFLDAIRLSLTARHGSDNVFVGFSNYTDLLGDPFFRTSVSNTVLYTAYSEVFKVTAGLMAALLLHNLRRGRAVVTGLVLLPWVIPTVVTAVSWRSIFDPLFGSLNFVLTQLHLGPLLATVHLVPQWPTTWLADPQLAMSSVILVNVWKGIPFFTINFLAGLKAIDGQLYEAASVDGANAWRRFLHVTLPGLRYVMLVTVLLSTIWTFNNFDLVWLLTQGGPGSSTALYTLFAYQKAIQQLQLGLGSAAAVLLLPISAILIFILARHLRSGERLTTGARRWSSSSPARIAVRVTFAALVVLLFVLDRGLFWRSAAVFAVLVVLGVLVGRGAELLSGRSSAGLGVSRAGRVPIWIGLAGLLFFMLAPLYWMVATAFKSDLQITTRTSLLWPAPWTIEQFTGLLADNAFGLWFRNTAVVAAVSTVVAVSLSALAAYALARLRFRGAATLTGAVLLTYVMPGALLFIPLYQILSRAHLIDSLWALFVAYPTFTLPFACWFLMGYFRGIPQDLEEAAMTDGATRLQAFRLIILPLAKPALLAVGLFTLTNAWNEFLFAFVFITDEGLKTLPLGLQSMIVGDVVPWGQLSAASILISVPVVAAYAYAQRFLVEGLSVGAVKG